MKAIPARFAPLVESMMNTARGILERGEKLAPLAFVGRSATGELFPVSIDTDGPENKELSANQIRLTADMVKADFIFADGVEGRFVGLLPAPTAAEQTVH